MKRGFQVDIEEKFTRRNLLGCTKLLDRSMEKYVNKVDNKNPIWYSHQGGSFPWRMPGELSQGVWESQVPTWVVNSIRILISFGHTIESTVVRVRRSGHDRTLPERPPAWREAEGPSYWELNPVRHCSLCPEHVRRLSRCHGQPTPVGLEPGVLKLSLFSSLLYRKKRLLGLRDKEHKQVRGRNE